MPAWAWIVIVIGLIVVAAAIAWAMWRGQRTVKLQRRFGSEYDRATNAAGSRRAGETDLMERMRRRETLDIRPLSRESSEGYLVQWREVQTEFVDSPGTAVLEADRLITAVMRERGYPMDDFEQRAADVSVDHPDVVGDYRAAHRVAGSTDPSTTDTEALREAMLRYRRLFELLVRGAEPDVRERRTG